LNTKLATDDTAHGKEKSIGGNIGSQVYTHKSGFQKPYHVQKADGATIGYTLSEFISDFGAPDQLTYDGAAIQVGLKTRFMDLIRRYEIKYHVSAPRRPNENPAEGGIRELKKRWYRIMTKKANSLRYSKGRTPMEVITGCTPKITEYLDFGFYDWIQFRSIAGLGPIEIGRWLGVSHKIGQMVSYWILP
jgi:hypothetical protein